MVSQPARAPRALRVGATPLELDQVLAAARGSCPLELDPGSRARRERSRAVLEEALGGGGPVYGVTTGVGASVDTAVPGRLQDALPTHLPRFHGCGTGRILSDDAAAAVVVVRLASLARGQSGVREALLEQLCALVNRRVLPQIPEEGSVGASGDLTPLSYLASLVVGEREASYDGEVLPAADALARAGLEALPLARKESLALMNGTSVMTALGCFAVESALRLARWSSALTAILCDATLGNPGHYDERIFEWKPHPGSVRCAAWIREDLAARSEAPARLQDRYSLRCAPHVIGVLIDAARHARDILEVEINGANDNPLVDPEGGEILHGGNFYGGHVGYALDGLKSATASVADLLDRQLALVCQRDTNGGLPDNLVAVRGPEAALHHGFKAMQISASALTAEALKGTMPATAFSRSTESHNQDKVSMGTIAARDALRIAELTEQVAAIVTLAACQAVDLREREGGQTGPRAEALRAAVRAAVPRVDADRRQDHDIAWVLAEARSEALPIGTRSDWALGLE